MSRKVQAWMVLVLGHGIAVLAAPPIAAVGYLLSKSPGPVQLDLVLILLILTTIFFSWFFYGPMTLIFVIGLSPLFRHFATKLSMAAGLCVASIVGVVIGFSLGYSSAFMRLDGTLDVGRHFAIPSAVAAAVVVQLTWQVVINLRKRAEQLHPPLAQLVSS